MSQHNLTTVKSALPQHQQWYALQTRSRFEKLVYYELAQKHIETYLPLVKEIHQWKDRKKVVTLPLFPGYLFARFPDESGCRLKLLHTLGVVRIVGDHGGGIPVPEQEIEAVKQLIESGLAQPFPFLREGIQVRVRRGPLTGVVGLLVRIRNATRIVISVQLLAQSMAAEIDVRDVETLRS